MKNGYLNKTELRKIARQYQELDLMTSEITVAASGRLLTEPESATFDALLAAKRALALVLRWQSFEVAWKEATRPQ